MAFWNRKKDTTLQDVTKLRLETRERIETELLEKSSAMERDGKYPFEVDWLPVQTIKTFQKKLKLRDKIISVELILLCGTIIFLSYVSLRLFKFLLLPK